MTGAFLQPPPFRRLIAALLAAAFATPMAAQDRTDAETLVMRLIFEDCLGYVRNGTRPFAGLDLAPVRPEVEASLPAAARLLPERHQLLSERYYTYWGDDGTTRLCVISASDDHASFPPILTVQHKGFLDRLSLRALAEGITEHELPERFDMFGTPKWSEPGDDPDELRIIVIPYEPTIDGTLIDMGIIIVAVGNDRPTS
jgi:hypothetical protein